MGNTYSGSLPINRTGPAIEKPFSSVSNLATMNFFSTCGKYPKGKVTNALATTYNHLRFRCWGGPTGGFRAAGDRDRTLRTGMRDTKHGIIHAGFAVLQLQDHPNDTLSHSC